MFPRTPTSNKPPLRKRIYVLGACIFTLFLVHNIHHLPSHEEVQSSWSDTIRIVDTNARFLVENAGELISLTRLGNLATAVWTPRPEAVTFPDLYEASIAELQAGLTRGDFTSVDLVKAYFRRIEEVNLKGPKLRAVLETNPKAVEQARALDAERRKKKLRGPLHGIPILVKDNIATDASEGMNTTAGSYALLKSVVPRDAHVVKRLRDAGAIILGKANMSQWSYFRGNVSPAWSSRGGQTTSAYYPMGNPCGSSSGSAVAASIGLAAATLGTETDGSIICPAGRNNIVGIKPTVGLTSRAGVIPISEHQDSVGTMARSVADAAALLTAIAGRDSHDKYTEAQPEQVPDYTQALKKHALKGARLGIPRRVFMDPEVIPPHVYKSFDVAIKKIKRIGATIVDPADLPSADDFLTSDNETVVLFADFKVQINEYFSSLKSNPSGVKTLAELIEYNKAHKDLEMPSGFEDQSVLIGSEATSGRDAKFRESLAFNKELGATRGIDAVLKEHKLDALILPMHAGAAAAIAGYPAVTVPMGYFPSETKPEPFLSANTFFPAPHIPIGLIFVGPAYSESKLLAYAYTYEQTTKVRLRNKAFSAAVPKTQLKDVVKGKA